MDNDHQCKYRMFGCSWEGTFEDKATHDAEAMAVHLRMCYNDALAKRAEVAKLQRLYDQAYEKHLELQRLLGQERVISSSASPAPTASGAGGGLRGRLAGSAASRRGDGAPGARIAARSTPLALSNPTSSSVARPQGPGVVVEASVDPRTAPLHPDSEDADVPPTPPPATDGTARSSQRSPRRSVASKSSSQAKGRRAGNRRSGRLTGRTLLETDESDDSEGPLFGALQPKPAQQQRSADDLSVSSDDDELGHGVREGASAAGSGAAAPVTAAAPASNVVAGGERGADGGVQSGEDEVDTVRAPVSPLVRKGVTEIVGAGETGQDDAAPNYPGEAPRSVALSRTKNSPGKAHRDSGNTDGPRARKRLRTDDDMAAGDPYESAKAAERRRDWREAIRHFSAALEAATSGDGGSEAARFGGTTSSRRPDKIRLKRSHVSLQYAEEVDRSGQASLAQDLAQRSIDDTSEVLKEDPEYTRALYLRAWAMLGFSDDHDEGLATARKALELMDHAAAQSRHDPYVDERARLESLVRRAGSAGDAAAAKDSVRARGGAGAGPDASRAVVQVGFSDPPDGDGDEPPQSESTSGERDSWVNMSTQEEARQLREHQMRAEKRRLAEFTKVELSEELRRNNASTTGRKDYLVERVFLGRRYGALPLCPTCRRGKLRYDSRDGLVATSVKCRGYYSDKKHKKVECAFTGDLDSVAKTPWRSVL